MVVFKANGGSVKTVLVRQAFLTSQFLRCLSKQASKNCELEVTGLWKTASQLSTRNLYPATFEFVVPYLR